MGKLLTRKLVAVSRGAGTSWRKTSSLTESHEMLGHHANAELGVSKKAAEGSFLLLSCRVVGTRGVMNEVSLRTPDRSPMLAELA